MSVYRRSAQLIWNQQISYGSLFRRLPTELSHILSRSTSTSSADSVHHQTNPIDESISEAISETITETSQGHLTNKAQEDVKLTRKERNKAELNRLATLRERLKNEDSLKVFAQLLDGPNEKDGFTDPEISSGTIIAKRKQPIPYLPHDFLDGNGQRVYLETYGCQVIVLSFNFSFDHLTLEISILNLLLLKR